MNMNNDKKVVYLASSFSLQMVDPNDLPCTFTATEVPALPEGLESAIGHADTAAVLGYPMNRISLQLKKGETVYVAQLYGGRLPEGATTLPKDYYFRFIKVDIK